MSNPNVASRFGEIYDSTNKAVLAFITSKCGRTADISDIFQDTYMELYKILINRGENYIENEKAFMLKIAKRKVARYYSLLERMRIFVSMSTTNEDGDEVDLSDFQADAFLAEDFSVNHVLLDTVRQFLESKPEDVQKAFYLMYDVELTIPEIAKELGISESNVKNKLYRTLKEIRNLLK
jgi:RNA polymerase sigma-70 factor (ECF subfamily)